MDWEIVVGIVICLCTYVLWKTRDRIRQFCNKPDLMYNIFMIGAVFIILQSVYIVVFCRYIPGFLPVKVPCNISEKDGLAFALYNIAKSKTSKEVLQSLVNTGLNSVTLIKNSFERGQLFEPLFECVKK